MEQWAPTGELVYTFYTDETCKNPVTENDGIPSEAGKYYLKVTYPGDSNYKQTEVDLIPVTIDPANLAVQVEGYNGTYDGTEHSAAVITSVTGAQGAVITGTQGAGANITGGGFTVAGLAGQLHLPKGGIFPTGLQSRMVAAGLEATVTMA